MNMPDNELSGDLRELCSYVADKTSFRYLIFSFLIYCIVSSKAFEKNILKIDDPKCNNNDMYIVIVKGAIFVVLYAIIDLLITFDAL